MGDEEFDQTDLRVEILIKLHDCFYKTGCFGPYKDKRQSSGLEGIEEAD